jgi:flagellar basal body-associated protein FliL
MEVIIITVGVVVILIAAIAVMSMSPGAKRAGEQAEHEAHAMAPGADVNRQFERPRDEGNLL